MFSSTLFQKDLLQQQHLIWLIEQFNWVVNILLPYSRSYLTVQRRADLDLIKIMKKPELENFLRSLDVLFADKFAQTSAKMLGVLDIVFRNIKKSNNYMDGTLIIFTMDYLQTSPIKERPLLTSS